MYTLEDKQNASNSTMTPFELTTSLSVILPAHNEEQVIADTLANVCATLAGWTQDFEVIVVDESSQMFLEQNEELFVAGCFPFCGAKWEATSDKKLFILF